jgi:hypothetical protein
MPPKRDDDLKENVRKDMKKRRKKLTESEQGFQTIEQTGPQSNQRKKKLKLVLIRPDKLNLTKPPPEVRIGTIKLV